MCLGGGAVLPYYYSQKLKCDKPESKLLISWWDFSFKKPKPYDRIFHFFRRKKTFHLKNGGQKKAATKKESVGNMNFVKLWK